MSRGANHGKTVGASTVGSDALASRYRRRIWVYTCAMTSTSQPGVFSVHTPLSITALATYRELNRPLRRW